MFWVSICLGNIRLWCLPCDLLIFSFSGLNLKRSIIHLMNLVCTLHVSDNVLLQLRDSLETVWDVLELLNIANDFRRLGSLRKIDQVRLLDDGWNTVLDEGQISQVDSEERNTRRIGPVNSFSIFRKVFRVQHQLPHRLQSLSCSCVHLSPGSIQSEYWSRAQCRHD